MRELLVINPNTSAAVTGMLQDAVQGVAGPRLRVRAVTARFGAAYIADEASYVVGAHAALDAWTASAFQPDAVLVGCFGDPGLFALRESCHAPVSGLAEASFAEAARHGRFSVVTGGAAWQPMLRRLADGLGHGSALAGIHTVAASGAELAAQPEAARALLAEACREAARRWDTRIVVLGGAALAGMAAALQPAFDGVLIDSVSAGARWALAAVTTEQP